MQVAVCIDAVFGGMPSVDAMRATRAAGFDAYEFWTWWDKDLAAMAEAQRALSLSPVAMCTRFVSMVDPAQRTDYLDGLAHSIAAAKTLDCPMLISQCGADTGAPRDEQRAAMLDCLSQAVPMLEQSGITLLLEPLNLMNHPGYYLTSSVEAAEVVQAAGSERVKMLFDLYHQQITEGDLLRHVERALPHIGHFHAAGNPGRHELSTGELHYPNILEAIRRMGYQAYVGLEYFPERPAAEGLAEVRAMLA